MAREDRLLETFVTLADTLVDNFDIIDFLQSLAERCVDLLDVTAAGIMLVDADGTLRHAACSDEQMRLVELFELQIAEGPCYDAFRDGAPVACGSPEEASQRWPRFAPNATEHGFAAVAGVPLRLRAKVIGALNLFSTDPHVLGDQDMRVVQAMADVATIGILQERAIRDATLLSTQLATALDSRIAIEQAKGIVAENAQISVDEAFADIRQFARGHNRLLGEVAREIIDGSITPNVLRTAAP
jgi:GAF domain-containing protein